MAPAKVVSLLEIMQAYVRLYVDACFFTGMATVSQDTQGGIPEAARRPLRESLVMLASECEKIEAVCTIDALKGILYILETQDISSPEVLQRCDWSGRLRELSQRLSSELAHRFFFSLTGSKKELFENPLKGWEELAPKLPGACISDVEEMRKCFALSRYPACVFHSMQVAEHGAIELGKRLQVKDHKPGWVATKDEVKRLASIPYERRTQWEREHFEQFIQINATIEALMTAWRNKIDHADGRLKLLSGEFNPDTAEDIMSATRAFMRRLIIDNPIPPRPEGE